MSISQVKIGNETHDLIAGGNTYCICDTAGDVAAKVATVQAGSFSLFTGARVVVKFTNANEVSGPTMNVDGTGAYPMYRYGTTAMSTGTTTTGWYAGAIQAFTFDGTAWVQDYWSNTTYTNVKLGHGYATCTTAAATTAKVGTLSSYTLATGGIVAVKFSYAVPASATLNINGKGAKAIYYRGAAIKADVIKAGDTVLFMYSSRYHLLSIDRWNNDIVALQEDMSSHTHSVSYTPVGSITDTSITPAGSVTSTFSGTEAGHAHTFSGTAASHNHTFTGTKATISASYTPAGSVTSTFSGKAVTSAAASGTTSVYSITDVGAAPSMSSSVADQCLTLAFDAGSVPTRSSVTVPSTGHTHSVTADGTVGSSFGGTQATISAAYTPAGSVADTSVTPAGTITETKVTPAGSVTSTFKGTAASHNHTFTGTAATLTTGSAD